MTAIGDRSALTAPDIDRIACQFLQSRYADAIYGQWSLDRRLEGFLLHCGLGHVADHGDMYNVVLDHVMAHIGSGTRSVKLGRGWDGRVPHLQS